jgi:hypothetical protein
MAWKQDLAKLKQQFGPEPPAPVRKPPPPPRPGGPAALDDEDAVFLSAMGLRPAPSRPPRPGPGAGPAPEAPAPPPPETFQDAVTGLKGLKPLSKSPLDRPSPPSLALEPPRPAPTPAPAPAAPALEPPAPEPVAPAPPFVPLRFQLAAGMAIEVDGSIDLRGHSLSDAVERLKDRLGDGLVLGWRSLLVTLGPDPTLHEGLLALLMSGQMPMVARYAQAPVPMGGTQAWLLYLGPAPVQS